MCLSEVRGSITVIYTYFKSPVVSRLKWSENVAIHLYSLIMSAAVMPAFGGCGLCDRYRFEVHPIVSVHVLLYGLKAK